MKLFSEIKMGWEEFIIKFCTYSQFSLFAIVMFFKVTRNAHLVKTEPLLLGEAHG